MKKEKQSSLKKAAKGTKIAFELLLSLCGLAVTAILIFVAVGVWNGISSALGL